MFIVAKVFTIESTDILGSTSQNPVDLTHDEYIEDEPMLGIQSLPDSNDNTGIQGEIGIRQAPESNRPSIISIEGITGVGKSTIMETLSLRYHDCHDVVVLREPSVWDKICVAGVNLLDLSYYDPRRYGFLFQIVYFIAVEQQLQEALKTHMDKRVIICEKSLLSARAVST
jgi:hypothetical protein